MTKPTFLIRKHQVTLGGPWRDAGGREEGREEGEEKRGNRICVEISGVVEFSSVTEEMGKPKSRRGIEFPKAVLRLAKLS